MKVAFIAGPFNGANDWERAENVRRAERVALRVAEEGMMPLCPHTNTAHFFGTLSEGFWYDGTLELLRRCDLVVVVDTWRESIGARREVEEARKLGKPVYNSDLEFLAPEDL